MTPSLLLRRFRRNLADYGWSATFRKTLSYAFWAIHLHRVYRIYRIDLSKWHPPADLCPNGLAFKIIGSDDQGVIQQIEERYEWLQGHLKKKIEGGGVCLAALQDDRLIGFNLIGFGNVNIPLGGLKRTFRRGDAWSEHIAVQKNARQKGLGSALRYRIFDELRKRGVKRLYGGALRSNLASLTLARKVGFSIIVDVHYLRTLGKRRWRFERVPQ
jgi:GNAT superfamily N-acetyltransferase